MKMGGTMNKKKKLNVEELSRRIEERVQKALTQKNSTPISETSKRMIEDGIAFFIRTVATVKDPVTYANDVIAHIVKSVSEYERTR